MRIINAYWEKRNLGVDVVEVTCDSSDSPKELEKELLDISVPYSVVKIPSGCTSLLYTAQRCNYVVSELSIVIEGDIRKVKTPRFYDRFLPKVSIKPATEELMQKALEEIAEGSIFATDRIALDPMYSRKIAGLRYYNWCKDVIAEGADMEIAFYEDKPVAFNVSHEVKGRAGVFDGLVGGVFAEAANKGLGFLVVLCELESCQKNGGKLCLGRVSSNNLPILRLHMQYGFEIKSMDYVLTNHKE